MDQRALRYLNTIICFNGIDHVPLNVTKCEIITILSQILFCPVPVDHKCSSATAADKADDHIKIAR